MSNVKAQYADVIQKVGGYYTFLTILNRRIKEFRNGEMPMIVPQDGDDEIDIVVREIEADLLKVNLGSAPAPRQFANAETHEV